jgi:monoamine oxidase
VIKTLHPCQYGCEASFDNFPELLDHERRCAKDGSDIQHRIQRQMDHMTKGGTDVFAQAMADEGSENEDLID